MSRPHKGSEPLDTPLRIRISQVLQERLRAEAIAASSPKAIVTPSDVARDAIKEGLYVLEKKRAKKSTKST